MELLVIKANSIIEFETKLKESIAAKGITAFVDIEIISDDPDYKIVVLFTVRK